MTVEIITEKTVRQAETIEIEFPAYFKHEGSYFKSKSANKCSTLKISVIKNDFACLLTVDFNNSNFTLGEKITEQEFNEQLETAYTILKAINQ